MKLPDTYIITGSMGWLGKRFVRLLAERKIAHQSVEQLPETVKIRCLILPTEDSSELREMSDEIEVIEGDIRDPETCSTLFAGCEGGVLIHTAGIIHPGRVRDFFEINVEGTKNLVRAAGQAGLKRAVIVSSNSPIGCNPHVDHLFDEDSPYNPYMGYGRSKMEMERAVETLGSEIGLETTIVRPPWFYGPDQPPRQTLFFSMIKSGKGPIVGSGQNRRSMGFVDNLCQGLFLAATHCAAAGETYWIADSRPYTMNEVIDTIERLLEEEFDFDVAHKRLRLPGIASDVAQVVDSILQSMGFYHQKIHVLSEMNKTIACSIDKAREELGYQPQVALEDGMRQSIRWCLENGQSI